MKKLIFIIAAVALIASPALAVDWNFYGSARMATFYESRDFKDSAPSDLSGKGALSGTETKDDNFDWILQGNSRLGATVKAENIGGRFEFGMDDRGNNVSLRRIFGTWDFGAATLKVGKDYTPATQFRSGQVFDGDLGLLGQGAAYGSRRGQIALSFGGFEVALIDSGSGGAELLRGMTTGDVDIYLPRIEAKFGMSFDTWNFNVLGGYQTYKIENAGVALKDENINSFVLGADAGVNFGPATIRGAISGGRNMGNMGQLGKASSGAAWNGTNSRDVDTIQGLLAVGFKFTNNLSFEVGAGYRQDKSDLDVEDKDEDWSFYANSVIVMAPGVYLVPEVGYYDLKDDITDLPTGNQDEGKLFYLGAKWQIDF